MAEIQRKVIEQSGRSAVSQLIHANDKETIAAWNLDLTRILHVFNVRFVAFVCAPPLTGHFQTELAINTNVIVSDNHTIVSSVHQDVATTQAIVTDILRTVVASREGTDSKTLSVSVTRIVFITESTLTIPKTQTRSDISDPM